MTNQNGNCIAEIKRDNWVMPDEKKITKITYHFSDGSEITKEADPIGVDLLRKLEQDGATLYDCVELLYKPLGKLEMVLGVVSRYAIDTLKMDERAVEQTINSILEDRF